MKNSRFGVKSTIGRKYNPKFLKTLWLMGSIGFLIYPLFAVLSVFAPNEEWLSLRSLVVDGVDLVPMTVFTYLVMSLVVMFWKPKTRRELMVTIALCSWATIFFTWMTPYENIVAQMTWFMLLFVTQILFGWFWFGANAITMIVVEILGFTIQNSVAMSWEVIIYIATSSAVVTLFAIFMGALRITGTVNVEVYERVKNREQIQSERLSAVINSINDAILNINNQGEIHLYNAATLSLFDTNANLEGVKIDDVLKLTNEDGKVVKFSDLVKNAANASVGYNNFSHKFSDGQKIDLYIEISPIRNVFSDDKKRRPVGGVIVIIRDITKQKSLDEERDEFIAVVSHELRTPVAIAEGALSNMQFLLEKGGDSSILIKSLEDAHQQILYLGSMVNDLSTLSRAQRGVNMDIEKIDIKTFVEDLHRKYLPEADKRKLDLKSDIEISGSVNTVRMCIEEIMQNFITNALKYTKEGSVTVGVRKADDDAKSVEFFVKDTGIGISQSDQKHVGQKFWRSEDYRTRETSGTGLGLHVSEQLAAKIDTKIELVSRLNHGSTFSFRLPLDKE
ncbi:MAG: PAS domain-containing sensor histidine kinase [Candidatus Nomurabacteria bacterium]|nr:PAS domain-containing sensor histidine kinase [Candidatus Nomurabacteria bacterium]